MEDKKLFLLDAFALIFRAYYALARSPRIDSKGRNTNAQFGFTNTLVELMKTHQPSHIAVCFDTKALTERHVDFADYKANRQETPPDILSAVPDIKRIIQAFNIPVIECDGYEADDIIGALSVQASQAGYQVYMVTPDKDYGQLVNDNVFILKPSYQGGGFEIMDAKKVCEKWDIDNVSQVIDILGLMGDAVDNIPGIKGVGEKTAAKLLKEYGTLENVLDNADKIKGAIGEKIKAGKADALMSKKLATIILNVPVVFHEEDFSRSELNKEELKQIFTELEFKQLSKRLLGEEIIVHNEQPLPNDNAQTDLFGNIINIKPSKKSIEDANAIVRTVPTETIACTDIHSTEHHYFLVQSDEEIHNLVQTLSHWKSENGDTEICFDTETTGLDANQSELVGLSFAIKKHEAYYIPCSENRTEVVALLEKFQELFSNKNIIWVGQNIKYDILVLKNYGIELAGSTFDTMLAHYLIEPEGKRSMDVLSEKYLQYKPVSITELIGKKGKTQGNMRDVELDLIKEYAAEDADITLQLKNVFAPEIKNLALDKVCNEVENPLVKVLAAMEYEGVKIDTAFLQEYSSVLELQANAAEESVYAQAGIRFNLASPKQLGEILFEHLKLDPKAKKTKTGQWATGEDVLEKLKNKHKICEDILVFRELTKLRNTYIDTLPQLINPKTGRVHTSYAQAVAVTGRLSSVNPNLQNIPIRTNNGREIRKAFIPRDENHVLISADYSQIELRIVAAISGDEAMCQAFKNNKDIHTATAAKVYNIPEEEVTKEHRYKAKSVNFGIIYGQGAFGLADNLGISRTEAKEIIDNYKKEFPSIQQYMDDTIQFAKQHGFVQTLVGRKRWLADINSSNFVIRAFAERNAINSPIQGTAADMIKLAMIKIDATMQAQNLQSKMILQVHDELIFDAVKTEQEQLKKIIVDCMQSAMELPNQVPIVAEVGVGNNWLEAH